MATPLKRRLAAPAVALLGCLALLSCSDDGGGTAADARASSSTSTTVVADPVVDPGDGGDYQPDLDPTQVVEVIDNPYLPFLPGSRWVYEGVEDGESERVEVVVTDERREVMGIRAVVVQDTVHDAEGRLVEDTSDWFTQDVDGNVWYLGEDVKNYEDGELVDTDGSWEAGVDGALPGIVMPAAPQVGDAFRQEYREGEAEDLFEIIAIDGTRAVPVGDFSEVLTTEDWNPLEPEVVEEKSYAPGVGLIFEEKTAGGDGTVELVEYTIPDAP